MTNKEIWEEIFDSLEIDWGKVVLEQLDDGTIIVRSGPEPELDTDD